jgi:glutathione S-transferase
VTPVLWHIVISHYSEKARWALDHKGIEWTGRTPPPGSHIPVALWLTRGRTATFPVLELDGEAIGDSTAIIAALEERFPQAPLYPADPTLRARALSLESFFDEEVGPFIRRFAFHGLRRDPEQFAAVGAQAAPALFSKLGPLATAYGRAYTGLRYNAADDAAADAARERALAGLDRLEAELDGGPYLAGDAFTVADLTAASMLMPMVLPPEGPIELDPVPDGLAEVRDSVRDRPGFRWVEEIYRRHRRP